MKQIRSSWWCVLNVAMLVLGFVLAQAAWPFVAFGEFVPRVKSGMVGVVLTAVVLLAVVCVALIAAYWPH